MNVKGKLSRLGVLVGTVTMALTIGGLSASSIATAPKAEAWPGVCGPFGHVCVDWHRYGYGYGGWGGGPYWGPPRPYWDRPGPWGCGC